MIRWLCISALVVLTIPLEQSRAQNCRASFTYQVWHDIRWVQFSNNSSGDSIRYLWSFGDGTGYTSTQTHPGYYFSQKGFYEVCLQLTSINGTDTCRDDTCVVIAVDTVRPPDTPPPPPRPRDTLDKSVNKRYDLCIYPNPARNMVHVCLEEFRGGGPISWEVWNSAGKKELEVRTSDQTETVLQVGSLPNGVYLLTAYQGMRLLGAIAFVKKD